VRLVLDASVAIAAQRPQEAAYAASRARLVRCLTGADAVVVPSFFVVEVSGALSRLGFDPNLSCSLATSSACNPNAGGSSCATAEASYGACGLQNCKAQCSSGGAPCESGPGGSSGTSTTCTGSASLDAGCASGQLLESCSTTTGSTTSCYYKVGSQQFACSSCTDTTSCAQAANAACH
jgi:hypothetical protein